MDKTGNQVNQLIDVSNVGKEFVNFYYTNLSTNINQLLSSGIIKNHTRILYNNFKYKGDELTQLFLHMHNQLIFNLEDIIVMDSGGRRADVLVQGTIFEKTKSQNLRFSQYFTIANNNNNWFLHNSLLSILE